MTKRTHRTTPDPTNKRMPGGIPYIIGNEMAERFSFYGMKGILVVFMTKHLLDASGRPDLMNDEQAKTVYHLFTAGAYFFPIIGAMIADVLLGKYRTILFLSLMYCVGHASLAMMDVAPGMGVGMKPWLFAGLLFIAMGAGAIKPCVSAHVGDQFGSGNKHLITQIFNWFYFSINLGAAASTLLTPVLLVKVGPWAAFGLPGVLMAIATFMFWLGRHKFIHVPPAGWENFKKETFSPEGIQALKCLAPLFLIFVPMFWAIFDQTGSAWVLQAESMNRDFMGVTWLQSQIQAINPILILTLIPVFTYLVYPLMGKFFKPTPLRKIGIGLCITALAFGISAMIETRISGGRVEEASSISEVKVWSKASLIDGPADGYGWASKQIDWANPDKHPEIILRLRERAAWTIDSVELNPYALAGPLAPVDKAHEGDDDYDDYLAYLDEKQRRKGLSKEQREALESAPDIAGMARSVTVLIHPPGAIEETTKTDDEGKETTTTQLVWVEVGTLELAPEDRRQRLSFDPAQATKVKLVVTATGGDAIAKLGEVRVLATGTGSELAVKDNVWPDVAGAGFMPSIGWQFIAYLVLTSAEIMVSIVCLEFAYTQSPRKMKSFIMGVYFLGVSLGNIFVSGVNFVLGRIKDPEGNTPLDGALYYWAFAALMFATFLAYIFFAKYFYKGKTYIQGEDTSATHVEATAEGSDPR
jgi:proton-dependent oligopeptide transporter, POT family